mgnify:CR=1 FL=1
MLQIKNNSLHLILRLLIVSLTQQRKRTVFYLYDNIWLHYFYLPRTRDLIHTHPNSYP